MAPEEIMVDADGREVRVSNPSRVIFPATERTAEVTKGDIVRYYVSVGDGIMRALRERPTTLERWPKGVHPGIVLSTRDRGGGDAFYQKRVPKGAPEFVQTARIQFPSGRDADEVCPTELAVVAWAGQMGPSPFTRGRCGAATPTTPTSAPGLRSSARHRLRRRRARRRRGARAALELGYTGFPKTSGGRGSTSTSGSNRGGRHRRAHAAIAFARALERRLPDRVTTSWWKEERGARISSTSTRTRATARSPPPTASAPSPARRCQPRWTGTSCPTSRPRTSPSPPCPPASARGRRPCRHRRRRLLAPAAARSLRVRPGRRADRHALSARLSQDAG